MRRCAVLLSLAVAASLAPASAAHAGDFCARVWTENTIGPNVDTAPAEPCVAYDYGLICHYDENYVHPYVAVFITVCHPRPI
ncbi:MAG TPA: hypothetical protein VNQ77_18165 [Frankiaceae bacterium]|nr:hypothetical protein [Frankiaceae bacterium]